MAVPAMTVNVTTNAMQGSPPASAVAAAAAAANDDNDDNDNDDDDGIDLDALCRRVRDLRPMLDASADCRADTKDGAAVASVECEQTSKLTKRAEEDKD